jgi:hypothetical protein
LALITPTLGPSRFEAELKARTYPERPVMNERRASGEARVGWAAMSQEGQGVGTEPICINAINHGCRKPTHWTYETSFACIDKRFGREPFPHKRARRAIIHRINETADVIIYW